MLRGMGLDSVRLRWPNDLLAGKSKLAGILVEDVYKRQLHGRPHHPLQ